MAHGNEHSSHNDGAVHVHVHPAKFYAAILGGLLVLTVLTVAVSYVDIDGMLALGRPVEGVGAWNLTVAILVATMKASLVVLFFMHLKDDSRFNALVFVGSLLFVGVFFAYTMNDTAVRGTMDRYNGVQIDPDTGMRAPGGVPGQIPGEALEEGLPGATASEDDADEDEGPGQAVVPTDPAPAAPDDAAASDAGATAEDGGATVDAGAAAIAPAAETTEVNAPAGNAPARDNAPPAAAQPAPTPAPEAQPAAAEPAPRAPTKRQARPRADQAAGAAPPTPDPPAP